MTSLPSIQSSSRPKWRRRIGVALITGLLAGCDAFDQLFGSGNCDTLRISVPKPILVVGDSVRLLVSLGDRQGRSVSCGSPGPAVWTSSMPSVLEPVSGKGTVVARAQGESTIRANTSSLTATVTLRVGP